MKCGNQVVNFGPCILLKHVVITELDIVSHGMSYGGAKLDLSYDHVNIEM